MFVHRSPQQGSDEPGRFAHPCAGFVLPYSVLAATQTSIFGLFEYALADLRVALTQTVARE
jgi:hypothetical protein